MSFQDQKAAIMEIDEATKTTTQGNSIMDLEATKTNTQLNSRGPGLMHDDLPSDFPDGGLRAYLNLAATLTILFCTYGWINTIGNFQEIYEEDYLRNYSPSSISWIGSTELFLIEFGGIITGRIYDVYGTRWLLIVGSFTHVLGLMLLSLSTKYYQFILTQGVLSPIGMSMLFTPSINCLTTWFYYRRGLALSIAAAGASLGGIVFPITVNHLIPQVGFAWTIRIVAFIILGLLIFANIFSHPRVAPRPLRVTWKNYFHPFAEHTFLAVAVAGLIFWLGLFLPLTYIVTQAIKAGIDKGLAPYLVPILQAGNGFGRALGGYSADRIGSFNTITICGFLCGAFTLGLWLTADSVPRIIATAVIYGFFSGLMASLISPLCAQISDIHELGVRQGLQWAVLAVPTLVGGPIGGAILPHAYSDMQIWCGLTMLVGAGIYAYARYTASGPQLWVKI